MALPSGAPQILLDNVFGVPLATDGTWVWWAGVGLSGIRLSDGTRAKFPLAWALVTGLVVGDGALFAALQEPVNGSPPFGRIVRMSKDGTTVTTLVDNLPGPPLAFAVDEDTLYWSTFEGGITRADLDGSHVALLESTPASSIAVDAHAVYFTTSGASGSYHAIGSLQKVPKTGGTPETIASGLDSPGKIALHGGNVYWVDGTEVAASDPNPGYAVMTACK
jgi:hypothetical protein